MAGGKGAVFDSDLLKLILNGATIAGIAENVPTPATQFYLSLHTADPGANGDQTTAEATYPGYARVPIDRSTAGFTVNGTVATLTATMNFTICSTWGSSETETWAAVGMASVGAGKILYRGPITSPIQVVTGVGPQLAASSKITES
jgi:hypothetical protein